VKDLQQIERALEEFVYTIEATGGVVMCRDGTVAPLADEDWIDLGEAYLVACRALCRKARIAGKAKEATS
jgi:hypothetical protein